MIWLESWSLASQQASFQSQFNLEGLGPLRFASLGIELRGLLL